MEKVWQPFTDHATGSTRRLRRRRWETELRVAIATYVRKARAVRCSPEQVIVTAGTQQGLYLSARVLLSRHDSVWEEDPTHLGITAVLNDLEARLVLQ